MTLSAALPAETAGPWRAPSATSAPSATVWRNERDVFAGAELGWIAEEARRHLHRIAGIATDFHVIDDPHLRDRAFALLAAHPRLTSRAAALLDAPVEIAATRLHCGTLVRPNIPALAGVIAVVPLGWRAEAPLGCVSIGTRPPQNARFDWPFIVVYRPLQAAANAELPDDCLWPGASIVAG